MKAEAISVMPIIKRKLSASISTVGLRWTKSPSGPEANIIARTATVTAATMIGNSLVMPTAVMMLSTEKTMSITTIWMSAAATPRRAPASVSSSASGSTRS